LQVVHCGVVCITARIASPLPCALRCHCSAHCVAIASCALRRLMHRSGASSHASQPIVLCIAAHRVAPRIAACCAPYLWAVEPLLY
jgi:hypothetical protein